MGCFRTIVIYWIAVTVMPSPLAMPPPSITLGTNGLETVVLLQSENYKGPSGQTNQLAWFRRDSNGFQVFRKWLSSTDFETGLIDTNSLSDFASYDEIISTDGHHMFVSYSGSGNISEYCCLTNLTSLIDSWPAFDKNRHLNHLVSEHHWWYLLFWCGISDVSSFHQTSERGVYSATTATSNDVVMKRIEADSGQTVTYTLLSTNGPYRTATFRFGATNSNANAPYPFIATLESRALSRSGIWRARTRAKYYLTPISLPAVSVLHSKIFATISGKFVTPNSDLGKIWRKNTNGTNLYIMADGTTRNSKSIKGIRADHQRQANIDPPIMTVWIARGIIAIFALVGLWFIFHNIRRINGNKL